MKTYIKTDDGFNIFIEKEFYEREAVYSVAYKYSNFLCFSFSPIENNKICISIMGKDGNLPTEVDVKSILSDLLDEQFRIEILKRTDDIRNIVYKKAFLPLEGNQ